VLDLCPGVFKMKFSIVALAAGLATLAAAKRSPQHVNKKLPEVKREFQPRGHVAAPKVEKRQSYSFLTDATESTLGASRGHCHALD
jgi:hypothetical protein